VYYPGLKSFPQHELAKRQMERFSGMIAFELKGGLEAGIRFMNALKPISRAVSRRCRIAGAAPASMSTPLTHLNNGRPMASAMVWCACLWVWKMYDIWADIEQVWRSLNILRLTRATGSTG
jgi:O-acetylhomoserine/O-acetylserine sulfhydrylase-like pyridoxal-dependent enzyme